MMSWEPLKQHDDWCTVKFTRGDGEGVTGWNNGNDINIVLTRDRCKWPESTLQVMGRQLPRQSREILGGIACMRLAVRKKQQRRMQCDWTQYHAYAEFVRGCTRHGYSELFATQLWSASGQCEETIGLNGRTIPVGNSALGDLWPWALANGHTAMMLMAIITEHRMCTAPTCWRTHALHPYESFPGCHVPCARPSR